MHRHTYFISYISKELIGVKKCMGLQMQLRVGCSPSMCTGLGLRANTPKQNVEAKRSKMSNFNDENPRTNSRNNLNIVLQMLRNIFSIYNIPHVI